MLGVRLDPGLERKLAAIARQQGRTRSDLAREAIRRYVEAETLAAEAHRQSLLVARSPGEQDAIDFVEHAADWPDEP